MSTVFFGSTYALVERVVVKSVGMVRLLPSLTSRPLLKSTTVFEMDYQGEEGDDSHH